MNTIFPIPKYNLIGHRGVAGLRPENTICSFKYAAEFGLTWIEFDVLLTKDEQWIVIHDANLERTSNGRGLVKDYNLNELTNLEAGLWYRPPYPKEKIPSLSAVLQLAQELNLYCNIEIKGAEHNPKQSADQMCAFLQENPEFNTNIMLSSFNLECLIQLRQRAPDMVIGYLVDNFTPDTVEIAQLHNFNSINCDVEKVTIDDINAATHANIPVFLYTVNDQTTAKFWISKGVTALFTDRPDLLL